MKKFIICGLIALSAMAVTLTSCGKYEDGPKISLLSKKSRIANTWIVEKATNTTSSGTETDFTSSMSDYTLILDKDGTYTVTFGPFSDSGTWELGEDKDDLKMTSSQTGSTEDSYRILRLKSKEMWLKYTYPNGDIDEIHYKQK